jgi:hypothetical protein
MSKGTETSFITNEQGEVVGVRETTENRDGSHTSVTYVPRENILGHVYADPHKVLDVTHHKADGTNESFEGYRSGWSGVHTTSRK